MRTRHLVSRSMLCSRVICAALATTPALSQAEPVVRVLEGEVPVSEARHFTLPFEVTGNIQEIQIDHDDLSEVNILDWGLDGPEGFRGWGGGNTEPAIVGLHAASRSYLTGPLTPGTWRVVVGKAKLLEPPGRYRVEITLRDAPTLAAQPERRPYAPSPPLSTGPRWYAGDLHVHSRESGDAEPTLDAVASFAESRGLDFVMLSDHNTTAQLPFYADVQARHPDLLLLPGAEVTTYAGHFNALGATAFVEHRIGLPATSIEATATAVHAQGALVSINHPALALGDACIGCAWTHALDPAQIDAVEIGTGDVLKPGGAFSDRAVAFWESLCQAGARPAAVGGSDDHSGGTAMGALDSPIGAPTTVIFAESLSVDALLAGVRAGNTVVKLHGPDDPMIEFWPPTVEAPGNLVAVVTGGAGYRARWVRDGVADEAVSIEADPFTMQGTLAPTADHPVGAERRVRLEVVQGNRRRSVTSYRWLVVPAPETAPDAAPSPDDAAEDALPITPGEAVADGSPVGPSDGLVGADTSSGEAGNNSPGSGGCTLTVAMHRNNLPHGLGLLALWTIARRRRATPCGAVARSPSYPRTHLGSSGEST